MRVFLGIVVLAAIVLVGLKIRNSGNKPVVAPYVETKVKHPYEIDTLMSHVNTNGKITIENQLAGQKGFRSYKVSFMADGLKQYALMHIPTGMTPADGWPVVMVNHGYITPSIYSTVNSYKNTSAYYANQGFLVLKPDYRGHGKSEGTAGSITSRLQYAVDALNLFAAIKSIPEANSNKIYLYGHSMGGEVSLIMAEVSDQIKAISLWAPAVYKYPENVTYFRNKRRIVTITNENYQVELDKLIQDYGADRFSALANSNKVGVPIIIHHSITDESVPYFWGEQLEKQLTEKGKKVTLFSYQNDNHDIAGHWGIALRRDVEFFRKN
jgi:hypothetical protein